MKTKLTLTVEEGLIKPAKKYATERGESLSHMVEDYFSSLINREKSSFSNKWRGKLSVQNKNGNRFKKLKKKYLDETAG